MKRLFMILLCGMLILGNWTVQVMAKGIETGIRSEAEEDIRTEANPTEEDDNVTKAEDESGIQADLESDVESAFESIPMLFIDTEHVYDGMDRSYQDGYVPGVSGGVAIVVLPILSEGDLNRKQLTARVDLGTTEQSPFVYKNYEKVITYDDEKRIYYVRFDLTLAEDRYNGTYPVGIELSARDNKGNAIEKNVTVYVTITDGLDPNQNTEDSSSVEEQPVPAPILLISACTLQPETAVAGEEFTAVVKIQNTSVVKSVQNMVITPEYDGNYLTWVDEPASTYVKYVNASGNIELPLTFQLSQNTPEGSYRITLDMSYDDSDAMTFHSSGTITIPVKQSMNVILTVPQIAANVRAGDTLPLDFQVMNLGRSKIYNVRCNIRGAGLLETSTAFIGNLEGGSEGNASMNLFISTKNQGTDYSTQTESGVAGENIQAPSGQGATGENIQAPAGQGTAGENTQAPSGQGTAGENTQPPDEPGTAEENTLASTEQGKERENSSTSTEQEPRKDSADNTEKYGDTKGVIILTYEDAEGQEYRQEYYFTTRIEEPVFPTVKAVEEPQAAGQWWVSVLVMAGILLTGGIGVGIKRRKRYEADK